MSFASRLAASALASALVLSACSSGGGESPEEPKPREEKVKPLDDKAAEKAFVTNLGGRSIKDMCDEAYTHWACYYEGVEASGPYLRVKLSTDGGTDGDKLADSAGRHWFNFVHCDFLDLDTIIVSVNGRDHNVRRSSTNADSLPC